MKKIYQRWFFVLVAIFLAGCATQPENKKPQIEYVTNYDTVYTVLAPPKVYTNDVARVRPPTISVYSSSDWDKKEQMLTEYIKKLNTQIENLIKDRFATARWVEENKSMIEAKEAEKKGKP